MNTQNHYPAPGTKPEDHPLAQLFPMADQTDRHNLTESIRAHGQREDVVLLDGKILDGRNRAEVILSLGQEPRYRFYDYTKDGASPLAFVMDRNLARRHLTSSQRATVAAEAMPLFEEEAKERQKAGAAKGGHASHEPAHDESFQGEPGTGEGAQPQGTPVKAHTRKGKKASAEAGKALGVSSASVERAKRLQEKSPEDFKAVKAGKKSLHAATKDQEAKEKAAAEYDAAVQRIQTVCGPSLANAIKEGTRMTSAREVLAFAALQDDEMLKIRSLVENGWTVAKAKKYKMETLCRTHRIGDLIARAQAQGGTFTLEIEGYRVSVEPMAPHEQPKPKRRKGKEEREPTADEIALKNLETAPVPPAPENPEGWQPTADPCIRTRPTPEPRETVPGPITGGEPQIPQGDTTALSPEDDAKAEAIRHG